MVKKILAKSYIYLILLLMYLPVLILIIFSFTEPYESQVGRDDVSLIWNGFSLNLFPKMFQDKDLMGAIGNTLIIAIISGLIATILGTLGAIGSFYSSKRGKKWIDGLNQIPVVNAEIIMAVSLSLVFILINRNLLGQKQSFNLFTLLVGHVILSAPFVYLNVKPKLAQLDPSLYEAALDLGAKPRQALTKIVIPQILPGIISGFVLAITLSLDDFVMTTFLRGHGLLSGPETPINTISTYVQSKLKLSGGSPVELRALTTVMFLVVLTIVGTIMIVQNRSLKKNKLERRNF